MTDKRDSEAMPDGDAPEEMLGDVWDALDVLPSARSTPNLASSTIEMAAVSLGAPQGATGSAKGPAGSPPAVDHWKWLAASVIVAACLTAGFVTGSASSNRRSPRTPELAVVIRHLEALEEAGSVGFLEAFAKGDYTPPMFSGRDGQRRGRPETLGPDDSAADGGEGDAAVNDEGDQIERRLVAAPELDAALADFHQAFVEGLPVPLAPVSAEETGGELFGDAINAVQQFEINRLAYGELPPTQREALLTLAETLADPQRSDLVEAARLWHAWVAFADPVERAGLVELPGDERLEWLDRRMRQWRRFRPGESGRGDAGRPEGPPPGQEGGPPRPPGVRGGGGGLGPGGPPRRGPDSGGWPREEELRRGRGVGLPTAPE